MKSNRKTFIISIVLLVIGVFLSTTLDHLGGREWTLLIVFIILGFCAGAFQAYVIVGARQDKISKTVRTLLVILSFVLLFAIKGVLSGSIPSHLQNTLSTSLYVQILFSIFGMFFSRAVVTRVLDKSSGKELN